MKKKLNADHYCTLAFLFTLITVFLDEKDVKLDLVPEKILLLIELL